MNLWLKWTLLVWLNAAFSFKVSFDKYALVWDRAGIVCGVFTFVLLYVKLDQIFLNNKKLHMSKVLSISVLIKSLFQLYPAVELASGMASTVFVQWLLGAKMRFVSVYCITLTDGFLLSLLVALIMGLLTVIWHKSSVLTNKSA